MKRIVTTIIALASSLFMLWFVLWCGLWLGRSRMAAAQWHGHCEIADGYPLVGLIAVGEDVYYDKNSDRVAQRHELIPASRRLEVLSLNGGPAMTLEDIGIRLAPIGISDERPQIIGLEIQSVEHPDIRQLGTIVTSREADSAGNCHLLGPLSFQFRSEDVKLRPGEETELRIAIQTLEHQPTAISPDSMNGSVAMVCTSIPGDRSIYAFDESLRPKMEISFSDQSTEAKTVVFDCIC